MSDSTTNLTGGCHCGANRYTLGWPASATPMPARRCTCTYCTRFNGTWTSHPDARLDIRESADWPLARYRFETGTADFLFCSHCGVTLAAVHETDAGRWAVVNINTLDSRNVIDWLCSDSEFDAENVEQRLERRQAHWISRVSYPR